MDIQSHLCNFQLDKMVKNLSPYISNLTYDEEIIYGLAA